MPEDDFLGFRTLLSGSIIKAVYAVGLFCLTIASLLWIAYPFVLQYGLTDGSGPLPPEAALHIGGGLLLLTVGNVVWRLACEGWILFFSLHEMLASLEKNVCTSNELLEAVSRQLSAIETNTEHRHQELLVSQRALSQTPAPLNRTAP